MARDKQPDDLDALLAEVEQSLAAPGSAPARRGSTAPAPASKPAHGATTTGADDGLVARATRRLMVSLIAGGVCAALVFVLFFFTPFTGAISGAMGAALAGFVTALLLPRRL